MMQESLLTGAFLFYKRDTHINVIFFVSFGMKCLSLK